MEINTEIWGLPSSWVDGSSTEQRAGIKYPAAASDTYREVYNSGSLSWNTFDISPCFWGIGAGSIWAQPHFLWAWCPEGDVTQYDVGSRRLYEPKTISPIMSAGGSSGTNSYISYSRRWRYLDGEHQTTIYPISPSCGQKVITLFDYTKIIVVPYVRCAASDNVYGTGTSYSLYDYFANTRYTNYPKILGIAYRVRLGDGINTNRSNETANAALLINHDFEGSDVKYIDGSTVYPYFAGSEGMSLLLSSENRSEMGFTPCGLHRADQTSNATVGDSDTGFRFKYCVNTGSTVELYYYDDTNELWQITKEQRTVSGKVHWCYYPYINCTADNADDVQSYLIEQIAYLGLPFVVDPSIAARGQIGDVGVFLPVFDNSGITTGQYEEGINALRLPNAEWTDGREGAGYNPGHREDDDYGYLINPYNTNRFATGLNVWCMYQQDILDVLAGINNLYLTDPTGNEKWQLDFKGSNPDDYIVSCKAMLLDVAHTDTTSAFKLGPVQFDGIACYKYNGTGSFSFGTIPLDGTGDYTPYGDFRDYQPYTTMELYIPLCGTVEIDPEFFVGHNIEIIMMYDIYTGACTAGIYRDNFTLWKAVNGQIGADIPVSAMQMGTYQNAIHSLQAAQKQNEIRLASSAVTVAAGAAALIAAPATGGTSLIAGAGLISGAAGLLSGVMQEQNYDYQIEHTQPIPAQTTAAETQNNFCVGGLYPILFVKRAKMLQGYDAEIYSHTIGNACLINGYVGSQTGLVMCSSVDLSGVPATVEEINAIKQALGKGVYV